ncbi:MAG TPA: hypothetical protein DDX84_03285 [Nitrospiraceae bacterium]|nr:hypothetical protein [Nitrospiraceae bacterium]
MQFSQTYGWRGDWVPWRFSWTVILLIQLILGLSAFILPPLYAVSLIAVPVFLVVLYLSPILSLSFLLISVLMEQVPLVSFGGIDLRLVEIAVALVLIGWLLNGVKDRTMRVDIRDTEIPLFFLMGWAFLSIVWAISLSRGVLLSVKLVSAFLVYFLVISLVKDKKSFNAQLIIWICVGIIFSFAGIYQAITSGVGALAEVPLVQGEVAHLGKTVRATTIFFETPNGLAFVLSITIILTMVYYLLTPSLKVKIFLILSMVLMFSVLAITFSRKSWLAVVIGMLIIGLKNRKLLLIGLVSPFMAIIPLLFSNFGSYGEALYNRIMSFFLPVEVSMSGRVATWSIALDTFWNHPIIGNGLGYFGAVASQLNSPLPMVHNLYLYLITEIGLVGITLFLLVIISFTVRLFKICMKSRDPAVQLISVGIIAGFFVILFQGVFRNIGLADPITWAYFGMISSFFRIWPVLEGHPNTHKQALITSEKG